MKRMREKFLFIYNPVLILTWYCDAMYDYRVWAGDWLHGHTSSMLLCYWWTKIYFANEMKLNVKIIKWRREENFTVLNLAHLMDILILNILIIVYADVDYVHRSCCWIWWWWCEIFWYFCSCLICTPPICVTLTLKPTSHPSSWWLYSRPLPVHQRYLQARELLLTPYQSKVMRCS